MATGTNASSALSLGRLGLGLGGGHGYAVSGGILGVSFASVLVIGAGALLAVGLMKLVSPSKKKPKADQT